MEDHDDLSMEFQMMAIVEMMTKLDENEAYHDDDIDDRDDDDHDASSIHCCMPMPSLGGSKRHHNSPAQPMNRYHIRTSLVIRDVDCCSDC